MILDVQDFHNVFLAKFTDEKRASYLFELPPQVSQTRLEARTHRPDVEMCRDPVYHRLVEEVGQIQESVDLLHRKLGEAESAHQASALRHIYRAEVNYWVKGSVCFVLKFALPPFSARLTL